MMESPERVDIDSLESRSSGEGAEQIEQTLLKKFKALFRVSGRGRSSDEGELLDANCATGAEENNENQRRTLCGIPVFPSHKGLKKIKPFLKTAKRRFAKRSAGDEGDIRNTYVDVAVESSPAGEDEISDNAANDMISQRIETNGPNEKAQHYLTLHKEIAMEKLSIEAENLEQSGPSEAARKYLCLHASQVLKIPGVPSYSSPTCEEGKETDTVEPSPQTYTEGSGLGGRQTKLTSNNKEEEAVTGILGIGNKKLSPLPDSQDDITAYDDVLESMAEARGTSLIEEVQSSNLTPRKCVDDASRPTSIGTTQWVIAHPPTSNQHLIMRIFSVLVKVLHSFKKFVSGCRNSSKSNFRT